MSHPISSAVVVALCGLAMGCSLVFEETNGDADELGGNILVEEDFESEENIGWEPWSDESSKVSKTARLVHRGEQAALCYTSAGGDKQASLHFSLPTDLSRPDIYLSSWIYLENSLAEDEIIALWSTGENGDIYAHAWLQGPGNLAFKNELGSDYLPLEYTLPTQQWVRMQVHLKTMAGEGHIRMVMGETTVVDESITFSQNTPMQEVNMGVVWQGDFDAAHSLAVDDLIIADHLPAR